MSLGVSHTLSHWIVTYKSSHVCEKERFWLEEHTKWLRGCYRLPCCKEPHKLHGSIKARQECLMNHTSCMDLWKLGKSAWDQELWKIQCVFCCLMRWCLPTLGSPKYILPVAIVKGRTVCIGYGVITRYRSKDPRCVGNRRVVWSVKEQSWALGSINTPRCSFHLRYPCISVHPLPASPCQTEWSWWWETDFPAT